MPVSAGYTDRIAHETSDAAKLEGSYNEMH